MFIMVVVPSVRSLRVLVRWFSEPPRWSSFVSSSSSPRFEHPLEHAPCHRRDRLRAELLPARQRKTVSDRP
jgi:hypothetical protein